MTPLLMKGSHYFFCVDLYILVFNHLLPVTLETISNKNNQNYEDLF